jgi:hypothetical protein
MHQKHEHNIYIHTYIHIYVLVRTVKLIPDVVYKSCYEVLRHAPTKDHFRVCQRTLRRLIDNGIQPRAMHLHAELVSMVCM